MQTWDEVWWYWGIDENLGTHFGASLRTIRNLECTRWAHGRSINKF